MVWLETSVEVYREAEQTVDNIGVIIQLLVHHQCQNSHLRRAAIVQLDGLLRLNLLYDHCLSICVCYL